jgi:glycine/D-amino acid oxidase-like deaminating enzyme
VVCDRGEVAGGSTGRAMGGARQRFSTAAEVRLAQESIRFFEELGPPYFLQVGYLFVAATTAGV